LSYNHNSRPFILYPFNYKRLFFAGRFAVVESDSSQSDDDNSHAPTTDRLSIISDDPAWSELADDVRDILRMKKHQIRQEKTNS
jgi:hypothetical protein